MGLEVVELILAWEEHFEIHIPDGLASTLETPRKAIDAIEGILQDHPPPRRQWTRLEIERDVCVVIAEQLGISRNSFTLDSYFVRDLCAD